MELEAYCYICYPYSAEREAGLGSVPMAVEKLSAISPGVARREGFCLMNSHAP